MARCMRADPLSIPKKNPRQPALAMRQAALHRRNPCARCQVHSNLQPQFKRKWQNSTTCARTAVKVSWTRLNVAVPYVWWEGLHLLDDACRSLEAETPPEELAGGQKVQAKGQPRPTRGEWSAASRCQATGDRAGVGSRSRSGRDRRIAGANHTSVAAKRDARYTSQAVRAPKRVALREGLLGLAAHDDIDKWERLQGSRQPQPDACGPPNTIAASGWRA